MTAVRVGFSRSTTHPSGAGARRVTPSTTGGAGVNEDMLNRVVIPIRNGHRPAILCNDVKSTDLQGGLCLRGEEERDPPLLWGRGTERWPYVSIYGQQGAPDLLHVAQPRTAWKSFFRFHRSQTTDPRDSRPRGAPAWTAGDDGSLGNGAKGWPAGGIARRLASMLL
jgi:hypothetical protein